MMRSTLVLNALLVAACSCGGGKSPRNPPATDAAIDSPPADPCAVCTTDQQCVQRYDGTCGGGAVECVAKNGRTCSSSGSCTQECQDAYCPSPYQCMNRAPCGGESPTAFTCYGP